jgi:hypothetical protein
MNSNRHGFRSSREFDEPDERLRIVFLGNSQVFGEGVEETERFTNQLEALRADWRVDNLALPGYGSDLMLRALEEVGLALQPDIVVFTIYAADFYRVHPYYAGIGFKIPRYQLKSGKLVTIPYPKPKFLDRSRIVQGMRRILWKRTDAEWRLNAAILDRYLELAEQHSFRPAIIFLPIYPGKERTTFNKSFIRLKSYAQRHRVPFLDLSGPFQVAGWGRVLIEKNVHLNSLGHTIVATEVLRFLSQRVLRN